MVAQNFWRVLWLRTLGASIHSRLTEVKDSSLITAAEVDALPDGASLSHRERLSAYVTHVQM